MTSKVEADEIVLRCSFCGSIQESDMAVCGACNKDCCFACLANSVAIRCMGCHPASGASENVNMLMSDRELLLESGQTPVGIMSFDNIGTDMPEPLEYSEEDSPVYVIDENVMNHLPKDTRIILILVGSRGDVQPYIGFSLKLMEEGYNVRIATHEHHRSFVERFKVDFFPIAGDPEELMEFMVENQLNSVSNMTNKITKHRVWVQELCQTSYQACTTSLEPDSYYRADIILANPPSFVGIHIAEKLSIPLIMTFTMPWTPTKEFPSPFVRTTANSLNYKSYMALDRVIWIGIRDIINRWRQRELGIPAIRTTNISGHRLLFDLHVPYIYCFSEQLLPKPKDWEDWIGVAGFYFLDTKRDYEPPAEIAEFLAAGEAPVFIGFGSIVVADPDALANCVIEAVQQAGCRAIIQQGWAEMNPQNVPENVLLIGPAPHDWLFEQCAAVVHHGGAGTTATGLRAGKPTVVVPFFGDQFFWGATIGRMELGPIPVEHSSITSQKLAEAITFALRPDIRDNAKKCGEQMNQENGIEKGVHLLKTFLPETLIACPLCSTRVVEVNCKECDLNLCMRCNNVIHSRESHQSHLLAPYKIVDWKHSHMWGNSVVTGLADGTNEFTAGLGTGWVDAVNQVSESHGVLEKAGGLGKGLFTFATSAAAGAGKGIHTTASVMWNGSPVRSPARTYIQAATTIRKENIPAEEQQAILEQFFQITENRPAKPKHDNEAETEEPKRSLFSRFKRT